MKRAGEVLIMGAILVLAVLAVSGHNRFSGPVLVGTGNHGLHVSDVGVLLVAAAGCAGIRLLRSR